MTASSLAVVGGVVGLVAGSFLNVVAHRVPLGLSVVSPPSACPRCSNPIRARDNVPVVSWLLLRGRCRDCGTGISLRYPLVEAGTAAVMAAVAVAVGPGWVVPAYWWFVGVGVALVLTDLDHQRIPNRILYPGAVVAFALLASGALLDGAGADLLRALAGAAGYFALMLVVALASRGGFGMGDVKLAVLLGGFLAFLGWETLAVGVFGSFVLGGVTAAALLLTRRVHRRQAIAFGPAMVGAAFLAVVVGDTIAEWYLG